MVTVSITEADRWQILADEPAQPSGGSRPEPVMIGVRR
jgi:hypothetical protein